MKKIFILLFVLGFVTLTAIDPARAQSDSAEAQEQTTDSIPSKKEVKNRNVMLNAESNTGPRQVNIGLPFRGDIIILENDVPVVYSFWPTLPTANWRYDNSLSKMGVLSFSEGALTWGKVGYAVMSSDRDMSSSFKGYAGIYANNFGSSTYDATITGPLGKKGWGYMLSLHENFDRGNNTNYMFSPWTDRTEMLKVGITKQYKKGQIRLLYKMADANININRYNPLVYEGDGETSQVDGFKLGEDSYMLRDGMIPYYDAFTGEPGFADLTEDNWMRNISHNIYLTGEHKFNKGWNLTYSTMYQNMKAPFSIAFPLSLLVKDPDQQAGEKYTYLNSNQEYNGAVQSVIAKLMPQSDNTYIASRAELKKKFENHSVRFGLTHQYYSTKSKSNSGFFNQTVEPNPRLLDYYVAGGAYKLTNEYGLLPDFAGGFGSSEESEVSKLAFYVSDDFSLGKRIDLGLGARIERQNIHEVQNQYENDFVKDRPFITHDFNNLWNKVGVADIVYKLTAKVGLLGEFSFNSWNDRYWDYPYKDENNNPIPDPSTPDAKPLQSVPDTYETKVLNYGGGVYLNLGRKLNVVSKVTRISKENNLAKHRVTNPQNTSETMNFDPIFYNISTLGWSTDVVSSPFENFNIHFLLTLQKPEYKDYSYSAFGETYNYSDNIIPELSQTLIEIDPSYTMANGAVRLWFSMRYFGKQYGNPTNAFVYNGWWENFGGIDYRLSRKLMLKFQVVNFLDQKGVKGVLQGADQITDATPYIGRKVVANGIRPRTLELTASFKF